MLLLLLWPLTADRGRAPPPRIPHPSGLAEVPRHVPHGQLPPAKLTTNPPKKNPTAAPPPPTNFFSKHSLLFFPGALLTPSSSLYHYTTHPLSSDSHPSFAFQSSHSSQSSIAHSSHPASFSHHTYSLLAPPFASEVLHSCCSTHPHIPPALIHPLLQPHHILLPPHSRLAVKQQRTLHTCLHNPRLPPFRQSRILQLLFHFRPQTLPLYAITYSHPLSYPPMTQAL